MAELLYSKAQMSEGEVDTLLELFGRSGGNVPFLNHRDFHAAIDELTVGDVPWQSFTVKYKGGVSDDVHVAQPVTFRLATPEKANTQRTLTGRSCWIWTLGT
jgi:hypothetical protein